MNGGGGGKLLKEKDDQQEFRVRHEEKLLNILNPSLEKKTVVKIQLE